MSEPFKGLNTRETNYLLAAGIKEQTELNKLSKEELIEIRGIGEKTADKIIDIRGGRPGISEERVKKLVSAFKNGLNITEACSFSGITRQTFYNYMDEETGDKEFIDKITYAQNFVNIRAKQIIVEDMLKNKDVNISKWWVERKDPEFKDKGVNVNVNNPKPQQRLSKEDKDELAEILEKGKNARDNYWKRKYKELEQEKNEK